MRPSDPDNLELAALVEPARVHRRVYTDPLVFELEMRRLWGRAWIYVGHESQVPEAGDFITTTLAREPVIMVRDRHDGQVRVLLNRCGHRGARLVRRAHGNTAVFRCPYHAWCYSHDGALAATPHEVGYEDTGFDPTDAQYRIDRIPRVDSYRGFVFASLSRDGPDLRDFLGDTAATIDNMADRSPEGRVEVVGRVCHQFLHRANWKMFVENLNDAMHPMVAHGATTRATKRFLKETGSEADPPFEAFIVAPFGERYEFFDDMGQTALPRGHNFMGGTRSIFSRHPLPDDYLQAMIRAYGEEHAREIIHMTRHNTTVYPSLAVRDAIQSIRVVRPLAVDRTVIESWVFRLCGAPESMLERNLMYSRLINSPASMVGPDDLDCYERMQDSLSSHASDWVDQHRFHGADRVGEDGVLHAIGTSDMPFRNQYRAWLEYMLAGDPSVNETGWPDLDAVRSFVTLEVRLLNNGDLDAWSELFTEDGYYFMPLDESMDDPERYDSLVYDNRTLMAIRAMNNRDPRSPSLERPVQAVRQVADIHLLDADEGGCRVASNFMACVSWRDNSWYAGRYVHALRRQDGALRIHYKRVYLLGADRPLGPVMAYL